MSGDSGLQLGRWRVDVEALFGEALTLRTIGQLEAAVAEPLAALFTRGEAAFDHRFMAALAFVAIRREHPEVTLDEVMDSVTFPQGMALLQRFAEQLGASVEHPLDGEDRFGTSSG